MRQSILEDRTPGLFLLQYSRPAFLVENVFLIPHFAFNESILECCKPLSPNAERAGWVGCNLMLDQVPTDARIGVIVARTPVPPAEVRKAYAKLRPLESLKVERRGWTLHVLNIVRSLGKNEFSLAEVYTHEDRLAELHPKNTHVRDKIRQQLQVIRDSLGLIEFVRPGVYRLV